jgi:hypothetical protein
MWFVFVKLFLFLKLVFILVDYLLEVKFRTAVEVLFERLSLVDILEYQFKFLFDV